MIHIVTEKNRALYAAEFACLERLIADAPQERSDLESGPDTTHLLALDGAGQPEFACRLRPAQGFGDLPEGVVALVDGGAGALCGPQVLERERIFAAPHLSGPEPEARRRSGELRLAVLEEARDLGADRIVEFVEPSRLSAALRSSWRTRVLGLPGQRRGVWVVAVEVDASAAATDALRESLARGPSRRLRLTPGDTPWVAAPKEVEIFLSAAQTLAPEQLEPLLKAMRAAIADEDGSDD